MALSPAAPRIVFCGSATLDTIFRVPALPGGPGKILPDRMVVVAHGMATSAAVAAARLGARSVLFSRLGADEAGQRILAELTAEGVDCRHIRPVAGVRSALCTVLVDPEGERLVVPFYDPAMPADPGWIPRKVLAGADAALVDIRWPEGAAAVLDGVRAAGKPAVLDADVGPAEVILSLALLSSHAVFSEPAALAVAGEGHPEAALRRLAGMLPGFVAVTVGAGGCLWIEGGALRQARPQKVVAVDTLAAGDVFHGAFTLALARGLPEAEAIRQANAAAAIKCSRFGGRLGAPDAGELAAFLEGED